MGCAGQGGQGLPGLFPLGSQVFQVNRVCHTSLSMPWSGKWREDRRPDPASTTIQVGFLPWRGGGCP